MIKRLSKLATFLFLLVVIVAVGHHFNLTWPAVERNIKSLSPLTLFLSVGGFFCAGIADWYIWYLFLTRNQERSNDGKPIALAPSFMIFSLSGLGKYVPGKLWPYAWQAAMLNAFGISAIDSGKVNLTVTVIAALSSIMVTSACLLAAKVSLLWKLAALVTFFVPLFLQRPILEIRNRGLKFFSANFRLDPTAGRGWKRGLFAYSFSWMVYGTGAMWLARELAPNLCASELLQVVGAVSFSSLVGALAVYAPGGLGVREATFYFSLHGFSPELRVALPILVRICSLASEVALAFVSVAIVGIFRVLALLSQKNIASEPS